MPTATDSSSIARPPVRLLLAVALISASVLGFEVALTRVFAVLLRYHLAFLAVSIAVCGLGLGGYVAHWLRRRGPLPLSLIANLFGVTIALAIVAMLRGIFAYIPQFYWLSAIVVLVPFTLAGVWLAEAFARYPQWSGRIYAWDLVGAALTAVAIVGMLQLVSAIDACLILAGLAAASGIVSREWAAGAIWKSLLSALMPLALFALLVVNFTSPRWLKPTSYAERMQLIDVPPVPPVMDSENQSLADKGYTQPLFTELALPGNKSRIVDTRWNAFARTDVVKDPALAESFYLYTNGNVPTNMMQWSGKSLQPIGKFRGYFKLNDWAFGNAPIGAGKPAAGSWNAPSPQRRGKVMSIGPGGGLDALLSLWHGCESFEGAEINPSIVGLMNEPKYVTFNGGLYQRPDVHVVTAEGRAYVREAVAHTKQFDLLFSALTKTATAGQGMALLESFIYTTDAFNDYLNALSKDGQLTILLDQPILLDRFFTTAITVLRQRNPGMTVEAACQHIALVANPEMGPYRFGIVVQKSPFTLAQTYQLDASARTLGLDPLWIPRQSQKDVYGMIGTGQLKLDEFIAGTAKESLIDISPCPDDRPFVLDTSIVTLPIFKQLAVLSLAQALGLFAFSWFVGRRRVAGEAEREQQFAFSQNDGAMVLYFLGLGVGFMLVEIPMMQKLILPLGYPTLALTVILFSILLGGGIGSWASQRFEGKSLRLWAVGCAAGVALVTLVSLALLDSVRDALLTMDLSMRCAAAALLLMPLGFLLGSPFPSGMRFFASRHPRHVPLIWGLNGIASVVGSLLAAMGAKNLGFSAMLGIGAAIYLCAACLLYLATASEICEVQEGRAEALAGEIGEAAGGAQ